MLLSRPESHKKSLIYFAVYAAVALPIHFLGMNRTGLGPMEAIIALGAQHMLDTNEWYAAKLYGELYAYKPPMAYWLVAVSQWLFGARTEFVVRLPTALAGLLLGCAIYRTLAKHVSPRCGLFCSLAAATSGLFMEQTRLAGFDMPMALGVGIAYLASGRNLVLRRSDLRYWLVAYLGLLFGFLSKGLPSIAVFGPGLIITALALRQIRALFHPWHLAGVALFVGGAAIYLWLAFQSVGAVVYEQPLAEVQMRGLSWDLRQFCRTLLKPLIIFAANLPWSVAVAVALWRWGTLRVGPAIRTLVMAAVSFLLVGTLVLMAASVHHTRYYLLLVTPVAVMSGIATELLCRAGARAVPTPQDHEGTQAPLGSRLSSTGRTVVYCLPVVLTVLGVACLGIRIGVIEPGRTRNRSVIHVAQAFEAKLPPDTTLYVDTTDSHASLFYYLRCPGRVWHLSAPLPEVPCYVVLVEDQADALAKRPDVRVRIVSDLQGPRGRRYALGVVMSADQAADATPRPRRFADVGHKVVLPVPGEIITPPVDRCDLQIPIPESSAKAFTVATFNIHGGRGRDGICDLSRVAAVVYGADFVGMQEASSDNLGDGLLDQPAVLAGLLGHPSFTLFTVEERALWDGGGLFGNAFTTSLPVRQMDKFALPSVEGKGPRGLGWVRAAVGPDVIDFFIIHVALTSDVSGDIQSPQVEATLETIAKIRGRPPKPCVFMGDFNCYEDGTIVPRLLEQFNEVLLEAATPSRECTPRRDYIFVSRDLDVLTACLIPNDASDHPAIVAVLTKQRVNNTTYGCPALSRGGGRIPWLFKHWNDNDE